MVSHYLRALRVAKKQKSRAAKHRKDLIKKIFTSANKKNIPVRFFSLKNVLALILFFEKANI